MVKVTVAKKDYDELVYPACAFATHETVGELRLCDKVLTKLEAAGSQAAAVDPSQVGAAPMYAMTELAAEFELEDSEAKYLQAKLTGQLPHIEGRRMRALLPLLQALTPTD